MHRPLSGCFGKCKFIDKEEKPAEDVYRCRLNRRMPGNTIEWNATLRQSTAKENSWHRNKLCHKQVLRGEGTLGICGHLARGTRYSKGCDRILSFLRTVSGRPVRGYRRGGLVCTKKERL